MYLAVNLYTEDEIEGETEFEIDKEKFFGRGSLNIPKAVENSIPLNRHANLTTDPIVAIKNTITVNANESIAVNLIITISENRDQALELIEEYRNTENIKRSFEVAKAKVEAESRYLGVKGKDIDLYQKLMGYLIFPNPLKIITEKNKDLENAPITCLWKHGISGDLPILVAKIKDINDIDVIKQIISAYEYFRVKNVIIDLVIIDEERHSYETYAKEGIINIIQNKNIGYLQNIKGGIFVINNLSKTDKEIIEARANIVIDSSLGSIERQIKDLEEEYLDEIKEIGDETNPQVIVEEENERRKLNENELKYYNEYGGFSEDGKEYLIRVNKEDKTPTVWSHILANENFGTVITENMGGYTWFKNSRLNRLTAWNNNQVEDIPSEIIYLEDMETRKCWTLGQNPKPDNNDYYITYGLGYAKYTHKSNGIMQKVDVFVPKNDNVKVNLIRLENMNTKKKEIKLVYYIKPVLDEDEIKSNGYINLEFDKNSNTIYARNIANLEFKNIMYVSCSEKINSYTGSKDFFVGNGTIENPDGLHKIELDRQNSLWRDGIIAIELKVELDALQSKDISIIMGAEENFISCEDMAYKYSNIGNVKEEYNKVKKYWEDIINKIQVKTPLESINIMLNGWTIYQTIVSRLWGRSGYYQSGGAFGFRDQLQDTIAVKYFNPEMMKEQIIKHSKHQFLEGDVEHWWHEDNNKGIRTRFSDDLLWLPYTVQNYIDFTGDNSILDIETNYLDGNILENGIDEKYDTFLQSEIKGTIYEHCKKAIEKSLEFGENGLPKIGSGDWNDGFSEVGNKGLGESVWLGFFLFDILNKFIPISEGKEDYETVEKYREIVGKLKKVLNENGWDGRWYRRAFTDTGKILRKYSK